MQRWATTLFGLAAVVLSIWLVAHNYRPPTPVGSAAAADDSAHVAADAGADPTHPPAPPAGGAVDAGRTKDDADDGGLLMMSDLVAGETPRQVDAGGVALPDGTPVPPLPLGAPRQVRFGVVLVSYAGAQPSAGGGKPATRTRADAKALAAKLLATAQQDFHSAVQQGDAGSSDDVGRVDRGLLEPAPEYVLFTLGVDGVAGPVDTPRGYWIVKRLE